MSLQDAFEVLNAQAEGRPVANRSQLISAALALRAVTMDTKDRDLLDAAMGLEDLATGGELDLNDAGRRRAGQLANKVAALMAAQPMDAPRSCDCKVYDRSEGRIYVNRPDFFGGRLI